MKESNMSHLINVTYHMCCRRKLQTSWRHSLKSAKAKRIIGIQSRRGGSLALRKRSPGNLPSQ